MHKSVPFLVKIGPYPMDYTEGGEAEGRGELKFFTYLWISFSTTKKSMKKIISATHYTNTPFFN